MVLVWLHAFVDVRVGDYLAHLARPLNMLRLEVVFLALRFPASASDQRLKYIYMYLNVTADPLEVVSELIIPNLNINLNNKLL